MPIVTEPRSGSSCDRTRTPLGRRVARMVMRGTALLPGLVTLLWLERLLARESDLPRLVDLQHLHVDDVALLQHVGDFAHPLVCQLRDVHQAVRAGHDLDERTEVDDLADRAAVDLPDLG